MSFSIVQGDLEPDMEVSVTVNGDAESLSDALDHELLWRKPDGTVVTVELTAVDLSLGTMKRIWVSGDTDIVGEHIGQIVVTRGNGEEQTFPSDGTYITWTVYARLA